MSSSLDASDDLGLAAAELRAGEIDSDSFVRRSAKAFRAIAQHAMRRWRTPPWLDVEDVEQDVILAGWKAVANYDDEKGMATGVTLRGYVAYNAYAAAKKKIHKARLGNRQHRDDGHARSRFELAASSLVREGADGEERLTPLDLASVPGEQDMGAERKDLFEKLAAETRSARAVWVLRALARSRGASVDAAAAILVADPDGCVRFRIGSVEAAERAIGKVMQMIGGPLGRPSGEEDKVA